MTKKETVLNIIKAQFKLVKEIEQLEYFTIQINYFTPFATNRDELTMGTSEEIFENLDDSIKFLDNYNDNLELIIDDYKKSKYPPINNIVTSCSEFTIYAICPLYYFEPDNQTLLV